MPIKYECDTVKNIVYAYPSGLVSVSDISEYFDKLGEDPNVGNEFIEVANLEGVEEFKFSYNDALQLPNLFAGLKKKKNHRGTILIGKKDFQFGMARMMSIISENDLTIRVVRSKEDAEKEVQSLRS
jgi:hypothetical protein